MNRCHYIIRSIVKDHRVREVGFPFLFDFDALSFVQIRYSRLPDSVRSMD